MALTHKTRLRTYLADVGGLARPVRNHAVVISEEGHATLPHARILDTPVRVKADDQITPTSYQLTPATSWISLPDPELIVGSVVVASDSSLGTVYREQRDYDIDYEHGRIRRMNSGQIPVAAAVRVWYRSYRVFAAGIDYTVQADRGRIELLAGSALVAGQTVLIDYAPVALPVSDALLDEAAREADRQIETLVASEHAHSSDPAFATAATYLALSIVAVSLAGSALHANNPTKSASAWLDWGKQWREQAEALLKPFAPPVTGKRSLKMIGRT